MFTSRHLGLIIIDQKELGNFFDFSKEASLIIHQNRQILILQRTQLFNLLLSDKL